jgi:peptidoglycan/LPS O-acetylase OafA/YrhL
VPFDFGEFGVLLFFLISGCVIPISIERVGIAQFWVRRCLRLYPAYWFSIACVVLLAWLLPDSILALHYQGRPGAALLLNLTMLHRLLGGPAYDLLPVYWTLYIEMLFYIGVTALVKLRWFEYSVPLACAAIVLAIAVEWSLSRAGSEPTRTTMYLAAMLAGTAIYRLIAGTASRRAVCLVCALCIVMFLVVPAEPKVLAARLLPLPLLAGAIWWRIAPPPLVWFGQRSYAFYLLHEVVMGSFEAPSPLLRVALWFGAALFLSMATYQWIERPSIALGRALTSGLAPRHSSPQARIAAALASVRVRNLF